MSKKVIGDEAPVEETTSPTMKLLGKKKLATVAEALDGGTAGEETVQVEKSAKKTLSKGKVTAPKELEVAKEPDLFQTVVDSIEALTEDTAIDIAKGLIDDTGMNDFRLGGVLSQIQIHGWWEGKNYENFRQFIEAEFGLAYRKSMYLIMIYNHLTASGVPYDAVKHLGWTKIREIAGTITLENMDEWIERAQDMTVAQIVDYIKASTAAADPDDDAPKMSNATDLSTLSFKVHDDQKEIIKEAVEKAKKDFSTDYDSVAMENIAMTYIEGSTGKKSSSTIIEQLSSLGLEKAIAAFESAFPGAELSLVLNEGEEDS